MNTETMRRYRTKLIQKKQRRRSRKHSKTSTTADPSVCRAILARLYQSDKPLSVRELLRSIHSHGATRAAVETALAKLHVTGEIHQAGKKGFSLVSPGSYTEATIDRTARGFGFAIDLKPQLMKCKGEKDPYIAATKMASARHGDRVLIRCNTIGRKSRPEAEVIAIVSRGKNKLAGLYQSQEHHGIVLPDDPRYPHPIIILKTGGEAVNNGDMVLVSLDNTSELPGSLTGEIVEVWGDPTTADVQKLLVQEKFDLPGNFNSEIIKEMEGITPVPGSEERTDLRDLLHFTIDGSDAKDFDDAICIEKKPRGFRLWVSIADVSAYVKPGSQVDREAYARGTSIYFPGSVIPMLPETLSNDLCSLRPNEDRLTVTVILDFDRSGMLKRKTFTRAIINSKHRFTYDTVRKIIIEKDSATRRAHKPFLTPLKWAAELATELTKRRLRSGSIIFSLPEAGITLGTDSRVDSIIRRKTHFAHQIIEEFMLAANQAVADYFVEADKSTLFRIHEPPDPEKTAEFARFALSLGLTIPTVEESASWFNRVIEQAEGTVHEYIINNLLLRSMQQARYSPNNVGHFGLAADNYLHFTSPIRRYPDLVVHRLLCSHLMAQNASQKHGNKKLSTPKLQETAWFLSTRERRAIKAEREMADRLKAQFMLRHLGETFAAVISGVSETSLYVELRDTFVSGTMKLSSLSDDFYIFDEKRYRVVGDVTGKTHVIGDHLHVELIDVDTRKQKIYFKPAG